MSEKRTLIISNIIRKEDLIESFTGDVKFPNLKMENLYKYDQIIVYDAPKYLPFWYKFIREVLNFKFRYHIAIYFQSTLEKNKLKISHVGLLYTYKNGLKVGNLVNPIRIPHKYCKYCGKTVKDWGGKKHLMHPEGSLVSDVWKHINLNEEKILDKHIPDEILDEIKRIFGEFDLIKYDSKKVEKIYNEEKIVLNEVPEYLTNKLIYGDSLEELQKLPDNSVDMIFIDPPYNLGKDYDVYDDLIKEEQYINWLTTNIEECLRVLKPKGSLFILNIPKWQHELIVRISNICYIQDWIVWDNQAEPKGVLIPAHYTILWLSKTKEVNIYDIDKKLWQDKLDYCLRQACKNKRKKEGIEDKQFRTNIWWDIHRVKHKFKRLNHPTQLPSKLLELLIVLTTKEGDLVLDPMMGVGTTPYVANKLNRKFIGIDISKEYVKLAELRLKELIRFEKPSNNYKSIPYSKKEIQIKVGEFYLNKGYIPSAEEFCQEYNLDVNIVKKLFPNWSKATKYARILLETLNCRTFEKSKEGKKYVCKRLEKLC